MRKRKGTGARRKLYPAETIAHVRGLHAEGHGPKRIAELTGIPHNYIKRILYNKDCRKDVPRPERKLPDYRPKPKPAPKAQPGPLSTARADRIAVIVQRTMMPWRDAA